MKNNIINILLLLIITIFTFIFSNVVSDNLIFFISLIISITITMFYKRKSINNKIFNIVNDLLLILSIISLGYIMISTISCIRNIHCYNNFEFESTILLHTSILTLLFINLIDIKKEKTTLYNILSIVVSIIVIIIYVRYYFDNSFIHNYMNINKNDMYVTYTYITQNYIYFNILFISLLACYFINKKSSNY